MPKRPRPSKRLPVKYPSVPDYESGPTRYNEPTTPVAADRVPGSTFEFDLSIADLRIQIEQLLLRRCSISKESWASLGDAARALLVEMLDDEAIRSREAILHRLISVLGELSVKRSVAPLAAILTDRSVGNLTKAYAANALGRIGEGAGVEALAASLNVKDEMVRRQVAMALGRIDREVVVPHLIRLQGDKSIAVAEVATRALRDWEQKLGQRLGLKGKRPAEKRRKKKLMPAEER